MKRIIATKFVYARDYAKDQAWNNTEWTFVSRFEQVLGLTSEDFYIVGPVTPAIKKLATLVETRRQIHPGITITRVD